jgi:hypothetical protein
VTSQRRCSAECGCMRMVRAKNIYHLPTAPNQCPALRQSHIILQIISSKYCSREMSPTLAPTRILSTWRGRSTHAQSYSALSCSRFCICSHVSAYSHRTIVHSPQRTSYNPFQNILTYMTIARQRLGKNVPEVTLSTIEGHPLLGNEPINTHS